MGLDDREALAVLASAFDDETRSETVIRRFYDTWFAIDDSARELFPPIWGTSG